MSSHRERPQPGEVEQRSAAEATLSVESKRLRGVIPYGVESRDLGGWREVMEPGCLRGAKLDDLVATVDHAGVPLGRFPGTLTVEDGADGLHWAVDLPESRSDVREAVERGDLRSGSWRMVVKRDEWRGNVRHVHEVAELRDVSVVTTPAYAEARAEYRSAPEPDPEPAEQRATPDPEEARMEPEETGGLRVEDRQQHQHTGTPESRILDAIASVPRGESRSLTTTSAAPVEPADLRTQLIEHFREASVVAASGVPIVPTDAKVATWPVLTGDVTAAFYDELEEIAESDPSLDDLSVAIKSIKAVTRASVESIEDSDPSLLQIISDSIFNALVLKGDRSLVAGSTATEPKGINGLVNVPGTQSIAVDGPMTWDAVVKAVGLLVEARVPGPFAVLMGPRPAVALDLLKETPTSNKYVGRPDGLPPVYSTGWLPITPGEDDEPDTTTALVYAPAQSMIVLRKDVTIEVDRSQEFTKDSVLTKGRYRLGLGVRHPSSIVRLTGVEAPPIA